MKTRQHCAVLDEPGPGQSENIPFLMSTLGQFARTLEEVVGLQEACCHVDLMGIKLAETAERERRIKPQNTLASGEEALQDFLELSGRCGAEFALAGRNEDGLVLENRRCPFGRYVVGSTSLCRLTASMLGHILAQAEGYAHVDVQKTIAKGDPRCRLVVSLKPRDVTGLSQSEHFRNERVQS